MNAWMAWVTKPGDKERKWQDETTGPKRRVVELFYGPDTKIKKNEKEKFVVRVCMKSETA